MSFRSTADVTVSATRCCVLFDPTDGCIRHMHKVVTMPGGRETSEKEMEQRIVHLAKGMGLETDNLHLLHVDPERLAAGSVYAVDPRTRTLIERRGPAMIPDAT